MSVRRPVHLFVLLDALGWSVLKGRTFLQDTLPYRMPLRTVLGYSSGAIPAILTGVPPAINGQWNVVYLDPEGSPFKWLRTWSRLPSSVLDQRLTRKLLKELGRRVMGLGQGFECCVSPRILGWFNFSGTRNAFAEHGIPGIPTIFDTLAEAGIRYRAYTYHQYTDKAMLQTATSDVTATDASVFVLHLAEIDSFLHEQPDGGADFDQRLDWYAARLRTLLQAARDVDSAATLTVFSDHGMTPVRELHDLFGEIGALDLRSPQDYLAVYDSTMARFWFRSADAKGRAIAQLERSPCGQVMPDEELEQLGVLFPDRRFGEVIFLLHPGWLMARSDFHGRYWTPAGMHGYHPDDPYSDAVYLSTEPPPAAMSTILDVHGCMLRAAHDVRAYSPQEPRGAGVAV